MGDWFSKNVMLLWRVGVGEMIVMQGSSPINEKDNFLKVLEEHDTLHPARNTHYNILM